MNASRVIALATLLTAAATPTFGFDFGPLKSAATSTIGGTELSPTASQVTGVIDALDGLDVTTEQAVGGTGALLGLAKNQLSGSDFSQLTESVPGLDQLVGGNALNQLGSLSGLLGKSDSSIPSSTAGMLSNVGSMQEVNQIFSALGMDSGLVSQFAPILLDYLGQQGVAGNLLQSLGSIWGGAGS